ncbi:MAG: cobalamin biosynthesis protein CobD [Lachnospiraceae bacterium]|nr:cobalamin biosynthesis protein CobD [Lachnospiraceae bacterium]
MAAVVVIWIGFLLDLILGDPPKLYHPVRWIGKEISFLEKRLLKPSVSQADANGKAQMPESVRKARERRSGAVMAVIVMITAFVVSGLILWICYRVHPILGVAVEGWLCYRMLAARCLRDESMPVYRALKKHDLPAARTAVSRIVGRDTETLDEEGVAKATVETIAENASDGAVAPLFYMMLFGAVGGFVYKAVNTMDSMVGYKNDKYQYFGTAAARIDDVLNFIPSRICAVLIILCSWGRRFDRKRAANVWQRDRRKHKSPNSAQSEAAMAGALGVELAGDASYFGKIVKKDTIGDRTRAIEPEDIIRANRMLYRVVWVMMILFTVLKGVLGFVL